MVDNGSRVEESAVIAKESPWVRTLRNSINDGYAGGNNRSIEVAIGEGTGWVVLLNDGTTVSPLLAKRLRAAAAASPGYGVIGPVITLFLIHGESKICLGAKQADSSAE